MIPYMVGKFAPNRTHFARGVVEYLAGRGYFRDILSENGAKKCGIPPQLVERLTRAPTGLVDDL